MNRPPDGRSGAAVELTAADAEAYVAVRAAGDAGSLQPAARYVARRAAERADGVRRPDGFAAADRPGGSARSSVTERLTAERRIAATQERVVTPERFSAIAEAPSAPERLTAERPPATLRSAAALPPAGESARGEAATVSPHGSEAAPALARMAASNRIPRVLASVVGLALVGAVALTGILGMAGGQGTTVEPAATSAPVDAGAVASPLSESAASTTMSAAAPASDGAAGSDLDEFAFGAPDLLDLGAKAVLVCALLYVTLRVLRRMQVGTVREGGRIQVLETRPLAPKASVHLVAVGERRLLVGLTPSGMVALAELDATELPDEIAAAERAESADSADSVGMAGLSGQADVPAGGRASRAPTTTTNRPHGLAGALPSFDAVLGGLGGIVTAFGGSSAGRQGGAR